MRSLGEQQTRLESFWYATKQLELRMIAIGWGTLTETGESGPHPKTGGTMARAKVNLESKKVEEKEEGLKRSLPQILETESVEIEERRKLIDLLEEGVRIEELIGDKPDPKKKKLGSGLLKKLFEIKSDLSIAMTMYDLKGVRHNNLVFVDRWQDGKSTFSLEKLRIELAMEGVDLKVINECIERATGKGDGFYVRQLERLDD